LEQAVPVSLLSPLADKESYSVFDTSGGSLEQPAAVWGIGIENFVAGLFLKRLLYY
jgi:hypothetical protein